MLGDDSGRAGVRALATQGLRAYLREKQRFEWWGIIAQTIAVHVTDARGAFYIFSLRALDSQAAF